jgi:hypothetical protein
MTGHERYELLERIGKLTPEEQLMLAEGILRNIRRAHFTDHEALRRDAEAMAADPGIQKALRNEDLPYEDEVR